MEDREGGLISIVLFPACRLGLLCEGRGSVSSVSN